MPLSILATDDELAILDLLQNCLSSEGHSVVKATSLRQANKFISEKKFDLLIVDIGLSDGSGLDLIQRIRKDFSGWIIILSGRGEIIDRVVGLELGADDYMVKPFHLRELRARVQAVERRLVLRSSLMPNNSGRTEFCGYEINAKNRSVKALGGAELHLTTKEFDVLWALVMNGDIVLSRNALQNAAFGDRREVGGRPIDGLISRLRMKMFPDGSGHLRIKTVTGRGYQISC